MARKSILNRNARRKVLAAKYAQKRNELRDLAKNVKISEEERHAAVIAMQKLPRDSARTRQRNRCGLTGRSRGVYSKFGLARSKLREVMMKGECPGVMKASW
jgi:small subunit ribosomal protein S14